ncbi:hypothetical protein [Rhodopirellula sp. MGV]|uniref:hypothetical protein n=1 Tax=Rhodopirellula sp. MGV TaxID=2023130 RepID=UPI00117A79BE|nr:hypothetical protein [Rhodopirellula sp. MGV]
MRSLALAGTAALILTGSAGCSILTNAYSYARKSDCLDDFMLSHRNKVFAQRAWFREASCHAGQANLSEFKAGFIKGYIDVANGGSGCTPSVAPSQYWGWKYQSPGGQAAIGAFFAGYPYGAKAAEQDGLSNWSNVRPHRLPSDPDAEPATEATPAPAPVMYGPDGMPLQEYIVPGSEVEVIMPSNGEPYPGNTPLPTEELLLSPESGETLPMPQSSTIENLDSAEILPQEPAQTFVLESSPALPSDVESYSLNDQATQTGPEQELPEDAIEGIFGSIDLPTNAGHSPADFALPPVGPAAATADADGNDIPFKFE